MTDRRPLLRAIFDAAVAAAHPDVVLGRHLPPVPRGRVICLAAGKGAAAMAVAAERHYLDALELEPSRLAGIATTRHGHGLPTRRIRVVEAGHPVPDEAGLKGADDTLRLAAEATADDLLLVLITGGGSANWTAPADGVSFAQKQQVNRALLRSGAPIGEINTVRKHLSRIKGGRLARAGRRADIVTLAISDVPRDDASAIASGPTVPDPTTLADARGIVAAFALGASAVQLGTAYLFCAEAKVGSLHRSALRNANDRRTVLTNVFTGRPARAIINRVVREVGPMSDLAPEFPLAAGALAPLRTNSEAVGSDDFVPMWSGQAARMGRELPAGELTRRLAADVLKKLKALSLS